MARPAPKLNILYTASETRRTVRQVAARLRLVGGVRAEPYAAQVQGGNVRLLGAPWNSDFLDEHEVFPSGKFKDQVDAASGAFNKLVSIAMFRLAPRPSSESLPAERAAELTRILMEAGGELSQLRAEGKDLALAHQSERYSGAPYHPGAITWLAQKGVRIGPY